VKYEGIWKWLHEHPTTNGDAGGYIFGGSRPIGLNGMDRQTDKQQPLGGEGTQESHCLWDMNKQVQY